MTDEVILTGTTITSTATGFLLENILERANPGDIFLRNKLNKDGRDALRGNHTNYGYSGYILGELILGGKKKRILNWRELFSNGENCFDYQKDAPYAIRAAENVVKRLRGTRIKKVTGGWNIL